MSSIIKDLQNFGSRIIRPITNGGVESFRRVPSFNVGLGICTHRDVKAQVFDTLIMAKACPDPHIEILRMVGDALITRSRSKMASMFQASNMDILWLIDDDIVIDMLDLTRMMWQMWKDDLDIFGAPYVLKSETEKCFAIMTLEDKGSFPAGKGAPIQEIRYLSSGCMGIRKRVFKKLIETGVVHLCHESKDPYYPFFNELEYNLNGKWINLSEDWALCQRARDAGFKVYCDFSVKVGHIGTIIYDWDNFFRPPKEKREGFDYNFDIQKY